MKDIKINFNLKHICIELYISYCRWEKKQYELTDIELNRKAL